MKFKDGFLMRNYAEIGCLTLLGVTLTVYIAKCNHQQESDMSCCQRVSVAAPPDLLSIIQPNGVDSVQSPEYLSLPSFLGAECSFPDAYVAGWGEIGSSVTGAFDTELKIARLGMRWERVDFCSLHICGSHSSAPPFVPSVRQATWWVRNCFASFYLLHCCEIRAGPSILS